LFQFLVPQKFILKALLNTLHLFLFKIIIDSPQKMKVPGTQGYNQVTPQFITATQEIPFNKLHQPFLKFIPDEPGRVLDIGAGIGRDAFEFCKLGHQVVAVEPLAAFREAGQRLYSSPLIEWIEDALPTLNTLAHHSGQFDFVLASGVWHHLNANEQTKALQRVSELLKPQGILALSLRNGPSGAGTHVFPTNVQQTIANAMLYDMQPILKLENEPSLMKNKKEVYWAKLVFEKN